MSNAYPSALNSYLTGASSPTLVVAGHAAEHNALEAKIGIGASTPSAGQVLRCTTTGTSVWGQTILTTDVTGTLPVANGGTGVTASTGSGNNVLSTSPTLVTPVLGVATTTSINKVTITAPTTSAVLTLVTGSSLITAGAFAVTLTSTGTTGVTLPTSGTLATLAGSEAFTNKTLTTPTITKPVMDATNPSAQSYSPAGAGTATLDLSLANEHRITMPAGNITIALSNDTNAQKFIVSITQDSSGSRTVTWFTTIKWAGGSAPVLTTAASKRDTFGFIRTGSGTYDGFIIGQNI